ncbi:MAG: rhomboid family intramembrane serine protease, partial [Phycisphaerae bacterium]|nr:rhomboid family intramembrane serine protease [Phycisphaerae bacterium]
MIPIPVGSDYRMRCVPVVNYALVAANIVIFLMGYNLEGDYNTLRLYQAKLLLFPANPELHQFFTSMFLHAGFM